MTVLFLRKITLQVAGGDGNGLDLSQLHIVFSVKHGLVSTPKNAAIRVYNVSDSTARTLSSFVPGGGGNTTAATAAASNPSTNNSQVILQAGYQTGQFGLIFRGFVKQIRRGRENATDTFIDIFAADGDVIRNWSVDNHSLAAGYTQADVFEKSKQSMRKYGLTGGDTPASLGTMQMPRGKACYGMSRDTLRTLGRTNGFTWTIEGGELVTAPIHGQPQDEAIELNEKTGLIGIPEQTTDGIQVRSLLNPAITTHTKIHLNNASILQAPLDPIPTAINIFPDISNDGFYKVWWYDHNGDTRGTPWYTEMVCEAIDATYIPPSAAQVIPDPV